MTFIESQPQTDESIKQTATEMQTDTALNILAVDCRKTIEEAGRDWLIEKIGEVSTLDPSKIEIAANKALAYGYLQESIDHHSEKVMERGYNEGRLAARCGFMIDDWRIEGWREVVREAVKAAVEAEGGIFADEWSEEEAEEKAEAAAEEAAEAARFNALTPEQQAAEGAAEHAETARRQRANRLDDLSYRVRNSERALAQCKRPNAIEAATRTLIEAKRVLAEAQADL
jgi:hypothetical protein